MPLLQDVCNICVCGTKPGFLEINHMPRLICYKEFLFVFENLVGVKNTISRGCPLVCFIKQGARVDNGFHVIL